MRIEDLKSLRTAPILNKTDSKIILKELNIIMKNADWFTIGIMAPSFQIALNIIRRMEERFNWKKMELKAAISNEGPVFLKANQNSGKIYARIEHGIGNGILISCHHNDDSKIENTLGPFPLDFFN